MPDIDTNHLLLIVTGSALRAEVSDRPLGYKLQQHIEQWCQAHGDDAPLLEPVVCSDGWYLNNDELHSRPAISIGGPGANALSAYLYQKLPTVLAVNDALMIQMDLEFNDLRCALWGMDIDHTTAAVEQFESRYLDQFMCAVV